MPSRPTRLQAISATRRPDGAARRTKGPARTAGPFVRPVQRRLGRQLNASGIDRAGRRPGRHVDVEHVGTSTDLATGDADDAARARELGAPRNGSLTVPAEA